MAITKLSKLKEFGVFHDFSWGTDFEPFKKFNLIYGWNRSGKTTISRIFSSCEKKAIYDPEKFKQFPENGEFEIKTDDGLTIKSSDIANCPLQVKVFNQDFIENLKGCHSGLKVRGEINIGQPSQYQES